ncbi:MAG: 6-hydroxymethylpterin diphosphokinase MptE-like protein [Halanaeroarchaeum sp.]
MEYADWAPIYERILADFGYDRTADERARDALAGLLDPFDTDRLCVDGLTVAIAGGAPTLADEVGIAANADAVFAASTAVDVLAEQGVGVDAMVTDLDKNADTAVALTEDGVPVVAHAHGDNLALVREAVPRMDRENVLGTTQASPTGPVRNFGGFTDGDRAAFLADHLGAARLVFPGWDFDDTTVDETKRRKLVWAERLLAHLETRRDERFAVLDGRRDAIDPLY